MDILVGLLVYLAKAVVNQTVALFFRKIASDKPKKKTTRKRASRWWFSKRN